jgi:HSP20 family molecular chaperone IbpA
MLKFYTMVDELFDDVFCSTNNAWVKSDKDIPVLYLELPGVKKEDIEISVDHGNLNVKAKRTWPTTHTFEKSYSISRDIDTEKLECKLKDGILEIKLPRKEEAKPRLLCIN